MYTETAFWMNKCQYSSYAKAPSGPVQEVLMVAEPFHQSIEYLRRGMYVVAGFGNRIAERKAGYAWSNNVERGRPFETVARCNLWCTECIDDLRDRYEAFRPSVDEEKGNGRH